MKKNSITKVLLSILGEVKSIKESLSSRQDDTPQPEPILSQSTYIKVVQYNITSVLSQNLQHLGHGTKILPNVSGKAKVIAPDGATLYQLGEGGVISPIPNNREIALNINFESIGESKTATVMYYFADQKYEDLLYGDGEVVVQSINNAKRLIHKIDLNRIYDDFVPHAIMGQLYFVDESGQDTKVDLSKYKVEVIDAFNNRVLFNSLLDNPHTYVTSPQNMLIRVSGDDGVFELDIKVY